MQKNSIEYLFQRYRNEEPPKFNEEKEFNEVLKFFDGDDMFIVETKLIELCNGVAHENFIAGFKTAISLLIG